MKTHCERCYDDKDEDDEEERAGGLLSTEMLRELSVAHAHELTR